MPDFRRGASAIAQAAKDAKNNQKGSFKAFAPSIYWKDDGDEKFILILNPLDEIPQVDAISFIPVKRKKQNGETFTIRETVIARTDPALSESEDPMVKEWEATPKETNIAVALELEPDFEEANGRKRPVGFKVKTREFERAVRDDEGNATDDRETVVAPEIGFVQGSPHLLFQTLSAHDDDMPLEAWPVKIRQAGSGSNKTFLVNGFEGVDVDLEELFDVDENGEPRIEISYLSQEAREGLLEFVPDEGDEDYAESLKALALEIGREMLEARLDELADKDRYDSILDGITESLAYKKGGAKASSKTKTAAPRRARRPARAAKEEVVEETTEAVAEESPKPKPKRRVSKKTEEPVAEVEETKPAPAKGRAVNDRLAALKAKAAAA